MLKICVVGLIDKPSLCASLLVFECLTEVEKYLTSDRSVLYME